MTYANKTPDQQENLKTLHRGMIEMYGDKQYDDHFDMGMYQQCPDNSNGVHFATLRDSFAKHGYGTSACLLGHGPIFGISHDGCSDWADYALKCFGIEDEEYGWDFLFSSHWPSDIQEAIARLGMYINGFDPGTESWGYDNRFAGGES